MKYKDEFQNKEMALAMVEKIKSAARGRVLSIMEVCGTHTMAIHRFGIKEMLSREIRLLSGPGCPVCVTPNAIIDSAIAYAKRDDCILTTFGDMDRVPGSRSSLARERALGAHVQYVYSAREAVALAEANKEKNIIFLAIGFETTTPTIAATILEAEIKGVDNFFVLPSLKVVPETLKALASLPDLHIDGFLLPGHVSAITGWEIYKFLPEKYRTGCVIAGFEPLDILLALYRLVNQIVDKQPAVDNQYKRIVSREGNLKAQELTCMVFSESDSKWRGIGFIPRSGLELRPQYQQFNALKQIPVQIDEPFENPGCRCGDILRGVSTPWDCPLYWKVCTPENPVGACMVSTEGTCAAYYRYTGPRPSRKEVAGR
ncbi:MAG: hydrogenase formation protein HypD [Vulcanimicrobiota bacterium]